jgi:hypothetical protein
MIDIPSSRADMLTTIEVRESRGSRQFRIFPGFFPASLQLMHMESTMFFHFPFPLFPALLHHAKVDTKTIECKTADAVAARTGSFLLFCSLLQCWQDEHPKACPSSLKEINVDGNVVARLHSRLTLHITYIQHDSFPRTYSSQAGSCSSVTSGLILTSKTPARARTFPARCWKFDKVVNGYQVL